MSSKRLPAQPMIGLLVRLVYQHYSQAMDAALREAGFEDIGPSAGNVFPFVGPEGITVSELADLAHVRKQTMAQAVEQLELAGYVERSHTRRIGGRSWCSSPSGASPFHR